MLASLYYDFIQVWIHRTKQLSPPRHVKPMHLYITPPRGQNMTTCLWTFTTSQYCVYYMLICTLPNTAQILPIFSLYQKTRYRSFHSNIASIRCALCYYLSCNGDDNHDLKTYRTTLPRLVYIRSQFQIQIQQYLLSLWLLHAVILNGNQTMLLMKTYSCLLQSIYSIFQIFSTPSQNR